LVNRVAEFEKVSFKQFEEDIKSVNPLMSSEEVEAAYETVQIPVRATSGSAGYDFVLPFGITLKPGDSVKIPTGIRVKIDEGWWLGCLPRSGLGFKYRIQLDNTIGVIDEDYYYSCNEGHIHIKLTNDTHEMKTLELNAGERFVQGILIPYGVTYFDNAEGKRNGGFGSTGK